MKILIELPTWLGDAVMTTPAIENIICHFQNVEITLLGSVASIDALKNHPKVVETFVIEKNICNFFLQSRNFGKFDLFLSFRGSLRAKVTKFFISSKCKFHFDRSKFNSGHQVEKYNNYVNKSLNLNRNAKKLILYVRKRSFDKNHKLLGISPGASYGNAKCWNPVEFAQVAKNLSGDYDIVIFGGLGDKEIADKIENYLKLEGVHNYKNLAGKLNVEELVEYIASLDLFISGDSGPMHIASALEIPTAAIFGPTNHNETAQWMNEKSVIVKENLKCQPCMKRTCPLKHNNCMNLIKAKHVLNAIESI